MKVLYQKNQAADGDHELVLNSDTVNAHNVMPEAL